MSPYRRKWISPCACSSPHRGGGRKGDLSRFIEEAVRAYLFERAVSQAKAATAEMNDTELTELIDEAVQWARER